MQRQDAPLYAQVRAAFTLSGTSLARWCSEAGVKRQWATLVLTGKRNGTTARALRKRICLAAGITCPDA